MVRSMYRDLSQAIKLELDCYTIYSIRYYPIKGRKENLLLASVDGYSEDDQIIQLYSNNIQEVMEKPQDICKLLAKQINNACRELKVKVPPITIGYFPVGYYPLDNQAGSYRICYYSKLHKEWFINDCYSNKKETAYDDYALAVGVKFNPYHQPKKEVSSYTHVYWTDSFYSITGMAYLSVKYITPQVATEVILYQMENHIEPNKFILTKLDEEGREAVDTANNLLTIKEVI